ncbi:hypothetical protein GCM10007304_22620 [Rhodococcoides trifolii]|uniref:Uncharacterized protein n=1 Tax=Rhodococcoides trifolii TaxID=908250 RepID=A0A917D424_9NOCA|nr:hypothetical protein [Rhodococcus trifolii]GGG08003.1 hypothetical protein GCM10007304_22620 [Rhodococcus trifolii]
MFWKIVLGIVLVWIVLTVVGALVKFLFPLIALSVLVFGLYLLFKAMGKKDRADMPL